MLKLFYAQVRAPCPRTSPGGGGCQYEAVRLNCTDDQRKPGTSRSIEGRVPALVTEHGVLTETPAIFCYVAQKFRRRTCR
jgi:glutathione S-transferase